MPKFNFTSGTGTFPTVARHKVSLRLMRGCSTAEAIYDSRKEGGGKGSGRETIVVRLAAALLIEFGEGRRLGFRLSHY